jgi:hypothetical protein
MDYGNGIGTVRKTFEVHRFRIGDVEDPDVYAAQPLWEWQNSAPGKWVMENAVNTPEWRLNTGWDHLGYACVVTAEFEDEKITEWLLRKPSQIQD